MKTGVILMTALVPTVGHQYLIHWAYQYLLKRDEHYKLYVIICTRDKEPTDFRFRTDGLQHYSNIKILNLHDNAAPQNPSGSLDSEFWQYWKTSIQTICNRKKFDFVFSSEVYGNQLAEVLGAEHIPVDPNREIFEVKGTYVRQNLRDQFDKLTDPIKRKLQKTIVFFGAESTGKTTAAKQMASSLNGHYLHEWARPYLETVGPDLNDQKMNNIVTGQTTSEYMIRYGQKDIKPFIFQDTDLLSTVGYYRIYQGNAPKDLETYCKSYYRETKNRLYIVMDTDIPFVPDPLRYGVTERESKTEFWTDLLDEFKQRYVIFKRSQLGEGLYNIIRKEFDNDSLVQKIQNFQRE